MRSPDRPVKLLVVSASPRRRGSSRLAARIAVKVAAEEGAEARAIDVHDYRVGPCIGCVSEDVMKCKLPCVIEDDMRALYGLVLESDGMIIVTPVYWYGVPGPLKNFIDRLTVLENAIFTEGRSRLEGKAAGFVTVGNDTGAIAVIQNLMAVFNSMGAAIAPWALAYHESEGSVLEDDAFLLDLANVVRCTVHLCRALKGLGAPGYWYRADREYLERVRALAREAYEELAAEG